jgi:hypothetical protein
LAFDILPPRASTVTGPTTAKQDMAPACFRTGFVRVAPPRVISVRLRSESAEALAEVLPLFLCGEESATLTFGDLAAMDSLSAVDRRRLSEIRNDEARHEIWLNQLRAGLPAPRTDSTGSREIRLFYLKLRDARLGMHLARIAALDSAVCVILGLLRQRHGALASDARLCDLFARIHRDEARHAQIGAQFARQRESAIDVYDTAHATRTQLIRLLLARAGALESLAICPDRLIRRLSHLPRPLRS